MLCRWRYGVKFTFSKRFTSDGFAADLLVYSGLGFGNCDFGFEVCWCAKERSGILCICRLRILGREGCWRNAGDIRYGGNSRLEVCFMLG